MVHIDTTQPDRPLFVGTDLWQIKECKEEKSRKGDPMLSIKLTRVANPSDWLFENIMLAGNGWPIGKKKLGALLPAGFKGELDVLDLIGKRLWVTTEAQEYEGQPRLRVAIASSLKFAGMQPEGMVPPGCALPAEEPIGDIPF